MATPQPLPSHTNPYIIAPSFSTSRKLLAKAAWSAVDIPFWLGLSWLMSHFLGWPLQSCIIGTLFADLFNVKWIQTFNNHLSADVTNQVLRRVFPDVPPTADAAKPVSSAS